MKARQPVCDSRHSSAASAHEIEVAVAFHIDPRAGSPIAARREAMVDAYSLLCMELRRLHRQAWRLGHAGGYGADARPGRQAERAADVAHVEVECEAVSGPALRECPHVPSDHTHVEVERAAVRGSPPSRAAAWTSASQVWLRSAHMRRASPARRSHPVEGRPPMRPSPVRGRCAATLR
jgi:hypothetical protein